MSTGVSYVTRPPQGGRGITEAGGTQCWLGDDEASGSPFQNIKCRSSTDGATPTGARTRSVAAGGSVGRAVAGAPLMHFGPHVGAGLSRWRSVPVGDLERGRAATASVGVP
ncbi:hypothetical protein GCM10027168_26440 [Streptomyces capparidis]